MMAESAPAFKSPPEYRRPQRVRLQTALEDRVFGCVLEPHRDPESKNRLCNLDCFDRLGSSCPPGDPTAQSALLLPDLEPAWIVLFLPLGLDVPATALVPSAFCSAVLIQPP